MAKKDSRRSKGLFRRVYSPLNHLISATRNISKSVFTRSGRVVDQGIGAVQNVGRAVTSHANMAIRNVTRRKASNVRKSRKAGKGRK